MDQKDRKRRYSVVRVLRLGEEPRDDLTDVTTVSERIAMVETLSREAWSLAGFDALEVDRATMPISLAELGSPLDRDSVC